MSKWWAVETLETRTIHVVWTLQLQLTRNYGSAFSLDWGRFVPILALVGVLAVLLLLRAGSGQDRLTALIGVGLVMGGAVGNLADRAFREGDGFMGGGVIDFIDVQWWPVWNVADMGVVIGAGLLLIGGLHESESDDA